LLLDTSIKLRYIKGSRYVYGKTEKEVREKLKEIERNIDDGIYCEPSNMTVKLWLEIWLAEYNNDIKKSTLESYRTNINKHIIPSLGTIKLQKLRPDSVQKFYNSLHAGEEHQKALSARK